MGSIHRAYSRLLSKYPITVQCLQAGNVDNTIYVYRLQIDINNSKDSVFLIVLHLSSILTADLLLETYEIIFPLCYCFGFMCIW